MKPVMRLFAAVLLTCAIAALTACGGNTLHKPTTTANAGTTALGAYAVGGYSARQYLKLPFCGTPAVQPCKTVALNKNVGDADDAAYKAAIAADAAAAGAQDKADAQAKLDELKKVTP